MAYLIALKPETTCLKTECLVNEAGVLKGEKQTSWNKCYTASGNIGQNKWNSSGQCFPEHILYKWKFLSVTNK